MLHLFEYLDTIELIWAMRHTIREFRKVGITDKQIKRFIGKATAKGIPIPNPNTKQTKSIPHEGLERVVLEADSKYIKYGQLANNENPFRNKDGPVLQNLANKFGELIYNKSFNDGCVGAFGKGQSIQQSSRGKLIILRVPRSYENQFRRQLPDGYGGTLVAKIRNSMNHYRKGGGGDVEVEFYDT